MKLTLKLIGLLFIAMFTFSCDSEIKSDIFDYGVVENNKYKNSFFEFELDLPKGWIVASKEQTDNLTKMGKELIAGDDANMKAIISASEVNNATLLSINQYAVGSPVDYNPGLVLIAENIVASPGIKSGSDYLFLSRRLLEHAQVQYDYIDEDFEKEFIDNQEFYLMNCSINYLGFNIQQVYYSTIINEFSLNAIISFVDEEQKNNLIEIIHSMEFDN